MSILIKSMKMPTDCGHCRFAVDGWCYAYGKPNINALANDGRTNFCPLVPVPDHGVNWISVKDKLPDLHDDVWEDGDEVVHYKVSDPVLCVYNGGEQTVAVYEIDGDVDFSGWVNCHDSSDLHTVTHWMPLPTPPTAEEGET